MKQLALSHGYDLSLEKKALHAAGLVSNGCVVVQIP